MSIDIEKCPFTRPIRMRQSGDMFHIDDATGELLFETDNKEAAAFVVSAINQLSKRPDIHPIVNRPRMTGDQIKTARKLRRLTQGDVADFLGVSVQAVSQWEKGKTVPDYDNVIKLQKLFPSVVG